MSPLNENYRYVRLRLLWQISSDPRGDVHKYVGVMRRNMRSTSTGNFVAMLPTLRVEAVLASRMLRRYGEI
jgi:hypothetical protein